MEGYQTSNVQGTQMIDRMMVLLRLVATFRPQGARLTDLAKESGLPPPTARRILKRLVQHGLIAQEGSGNRYSIGPFARELGLAPNLTREIAERHRDLVERLARETGAVGYLLMRSALDSLCIDRIDSHATGPLTTLAIGDRLPLGVGVGGMVLLAAMPADKAEMIIAANQMIYKRFVRTTGASFRDHLDAARRDGHVIRRSPVTPGIIGFGMAIPTSNGIPDLAIAGAVSTSDFTPNRRAEVVARMRELVLTHATSVS
ncbi:IclR family transcriptional regulator [Chelativorans sp. Marseille-P2723]|uniref:IclR family transcriptional regulator n=1 Tax=Chelativorans sp. Marseille-P2723 TaxID=2709133 RepID=UPI00156E92A7|nr:IclR family transcriptional regulator [Chelativorans sp. Marseille-P2723]